MESSRSPPGRVSAMAPVWSTPSGQVKPRPTKSDVGVAESSLAAQEKRARSEQQAKSEAAFRDEPFVRDVLERFDAKIRPDSIKPVS